MQHQEPLRYGAVHWIDQQEGPVVVEIIRGHRKYDGSVFLKAGKPPTKQKIWELIMKLARENCS